MPQSVWIECALRRRRGWMWTKKPINHRVGGDSSLIPSANYFSAGAAGGVSVQLLIRLLLRRQIKINLKFDCPSVSCSKAHSPASSSAVA